MSRPFPDSPPLLPIIQFQLTILSPSIKPGGVCTKCFSGIVNPMSKKEVLMHLNEMVYEYQ